MSERFFVKVNGKTIGPYELPVIQGFYRKKEFRSAAQLRPENSDRWLPASVLHNQLVIQTESSDQPVFEEVTGVASSSHNERFGTLIEWYVLLAKIIGVFVLVASIFAGILLFEKDRTSACTTIIGGAVSLLMCFVSAEMCRAVVIVVNNTSRMCDVLERMAADTLKGK